MKFWRNSWCSQEPFKVMFPILFALFKAKEAWVPDLWEQRERGGVWNFHFARNPNDWELDSMERSLFQQQGHWVNREQEDRVV